MASGYCAIARDKAIDVTVSFDQQPRPRR